MHSFQKIASVFALSFALGVPDLHAKETPKKAGTYSPVSPEVDNSKINKRDDSITNPAADQQSNDKQDVELTRKIRRALTENKSLSTYAHNIKIITMNGEVILKGPVRSADEKRIAEAAAIKAAGATHVKSELEITSN